MLHPNNIQANLSFALKLVKSLSPIPFFGPKTWLLTGISASNTFLSEAKKTMKATSTTIHSLKEGIPAVGQGDLCVLVSPSSRRDYNFAKEIALLENSGAVVILNGFAKDLKSIPGTATMGYFLKPLTYNSQVAGYLIRCFPGDWKTMDAVSKEVLETFTDAEILVKGTNTPDLRQSGNLVQKSTDKRAISARKGTGTLW